MRAPKEGLNWSRKRPAPSGRSPGGNTLATPWRRPCWRRLWPAQLSLLAVGGQPQPLAGQACRGKSAASMGFVGSASLGWLEGLGVRTDAKLLASRTALEARGPPFLGWPPAMGSRPGGRGRPTPAPTQGAPRGVQAMGMDGGESSAAISAPSGTPASGELGLEQRQWPGACA